MTPTHQKERQHKHMANTSGSVFKGLAALRKADAEREAASASRVNWLKVEIPKGKDSKTVEIVFLQELDESSERYIEANGTFLFAQEHSNPAPGQFFRRVVCTNNEDHDGQCWPCQKNQQLWNNNVNIESQDDKYKGGWKPKTNMYVNVLVFDEDEEPYVAVLSRTRTSNSYVDQLIEDAEDEGYVSNVRYRLTRSGEGFDTKYRLKRLKDAELDLTEYTDQLIDLTTVITEVEYDQQMEKLGVTAAPERKSIPTSSSDDESDSNYDDDSDDWL